MDVVGSSNGSRAVTPDVDVVVVGAGFAGLYLIHQMRGLGFSVRCYDQAGDVGGTWYWNRYPGARCDIPTTDYTYSFDPDLEREWSWSEKYATQPEILRYLDFVANRYDLRRDIQFNTRIQQAVWDDGARLWRLRTDQGQDVTSRFYVMASGCLSLPKTPDIDGYGSFRGEVYFTGRWPHEPVDFSGKRVAVIGTGSSGIQAIPLIAQQAEQLTVFQRTPNFAVPAHNGPVPPETLAQLQADREAYREEAKFSRGGVPREPTEVMGRFAPEEQRRERLEAAYAEGHLFAILGVFADQGVNLESNQIVADFIRDKIRERVSDPQVAEELCPTDHPFGTKRPCLETNYYETFNLPHVRLVNVRKTPIERITASGIDTSAESMEFDAIVFATGFDAMTGPLVSVDITGRDGVTLKEKWADGPSTYLGLTTVGFPNFFAVTGPGSPSVLSNMTVSIEQHVDWISDCLAYLREHGFDTIEPTPSAEDGWNQHASDCVAITLYPHANSWYMGANVPGKPRVFYPYIGGVDNYRKACNEVAARGYLGFALRGPAGEQCNDGVIRRLQPDAQAVLDLMAEMGVPPLETLPVADMRAFMEASATMAPPGPDVAEMVDGMLPGAGGDLAYRLYRPDGVGPHPVIAYFHGGGWVLGSQVSDESLCRDLCVRTGAVVVSVNYRHAPEDRFPAAADDAFAAVQWIGANMIELGGIPGQLVVAGWSAGGNLATVAAQRARDEGGPAIAAQLLLMPVTDADFSRPSYAENAEGYGLTTALMRWFWEQYLEADGRGDPKATPLHGHLSGLPPTVLVTAEFDPLRDEGEAYAEALRDAGVEVWHQRARGHTHTSLTMVDIVISGEPVRADVAQALRNLLPAPVPA